MNPLTEANRAMLADFVELFMRQRKVREAFEKHVSPDYTQHAGGFGDGREATIQGLEAMFAEMPEPRIEVQRILVDGDHGAVHLHARSGPDDPGIQGCDIFRFADGKIVEHWEVVQPVKAGSNERAY